MQEAYSGATIDTAAEFLTNNVAEEKVDALRKFLAPKKKSDLDKESPDDRETRLEKEDIARGTLRASKLDLHVDIFSDQDKELLGCIKCIVKMFQGGSKTIDVCVVFKLRLIMNFSEFDRC